MHPCYFSRLSSQRAIFLRHVRQRRQQQQHQQRRALFHGLQLVPSRNVAASSSSSLASELAIPVPGRCAGSTRRIILQNITTRQSVQQQQRSTTASARLRKLNSSKKEKQDQDGKLWQSDHSFDEKRNTQDDNTPHVITARGQQHNLKQKQQQKRQQLDDDVTAAVSTSNSSSSSFFSCSSGGSSSKNDAMRRLAAQCLPHWLSRRDRVWRNRTMQHLNLLPPSTTTTTTTASKTTTTTTKKSYKKKKSNIDHDESSSTSPLRLFQNESAASSSSQRLSGYDLYYDSFDSFHERIQQHVGDDIYSIDSTNKTTTSRTISNELQQALDHLVDAGFANLHFAQRFNQYEDFYGRVENLLVKMAIPNGELQAWQRQRDQATRQLTKAKRKYDHLLRQQQEESALLVAKAGAAADAAAGKSASTSSSTEKTPEELADSNAQSPVRSLLTAFKGFLFPTTTSTSSSSSTEPQQVETTARKANTIEQKQASLLVKKRHDMERTIKSLERSIVHCDSHIQSARQRLDKVTKKKQALEQSAPMTSAEFEKANQVVERVMNVVCQDLARHIDERHSHILEQYRVLDAK
jgi:hypothetical protein